MEFLLDPYRHFDRVAIADEKSKYDATKVLLEKKKAKAEDPYSFIKVTNKEKKILEPQG